MSDESHDTRDQRASVAQAAQMLGISEGAVRKRVERGKMRAEHDAAGRLVVYLDATTTASDTRRDRRGQSYDTNEGDRYTRSLADQVEYLRGQLEEERESRRRADTIIAQLSQANAEQARTIRALEAPVPKSDSPREWAVDEEVAREDEGMEGRPGVSEEQKDYERYVRPYEDAESPESTGPRATPTDAGEGREKGTRRSWWRRMFGGGQ